MTDANITWVKKDAFVMPVLPDSLNVDPLIAGFIHMAAFLELSGNDAVDPDYACEAMEHVAHYFHRLTPEAQASFATQAQRVAAYAREQQWGDKAVNFFNILDRFVWFGPED
jgi:hypothetical protein